MLPADHFTVNLNPDLNKVSSEDLNTEQTGLANATLTDALGKSHKQYQSDLVRIVSLVPSITELLCDLGLHSVLVGRTGFCIHPAQSVQSITKIGGTKDVNIEKIRRLNATHLVVNIDENEKATVEQLAKFIPHVIVTHPIQVRDNLALYRLLGGIFQREQDAERLCQAFETAYASLTPEGRPKKVLYCFWKNPWMSVSSATYISNMLSLIGWESWTLEHTEMRYPVFDFNSEMLAQIDLILLSTEPYRFTCEDVQDLQIKTGKTVLLVDGEMLSWYGSRAILGLDYLQQLSLTRN